MPRDNAERVVQGARHLSPHLGERMRSATLQDRPVVLRELLPQDLKLESSRSNRKKPWRSRVTLPSWWAMRTHGK